MEIAGTRGVCDGKIGQIPELVSGMAKKDWWRTATHRTTFVAISALMQQTEKLIGGVMKRILQDSEVEEVVAQSDYSNSFSGNNIE